MMFYVLLALMVAVAVAFVVWPLLRSPRAPSISVEAANVEAFRQQRRELDAERSNGLLSADEHARALDELAARLSTELPDDTSGKLADSRGVSGKNAPKSAWILAFSISLFIVVGSAVAYAAWGDHAARQASAQGGSVTAGFDPNAPMTDKQVVELVNALAKKMEENPGDPKGWILLARSQNALGQFGLAVKAYERAVALQPGDADLLADYADAQAMVQEGDLAGLPTELTQRALKIDPNNLKALALAGTAAMRAGEKPAAIGYWTRMQKLLPPDSEDARQVAAIITEIKTGKPATSNATAAPATPAAPAPATAAAPQAERADGVRLAGQIRLADALRSRLAAGDTLFVFARAKEGPRLPLAVLRIGVPSQWPYAFELTDAMAMAPGMNLSSASAVVIEARVSKSGTAQPQPGDLAGQSAVIEIAPVAPAGQSGKSRNRSDIVITIDKVIP
jgi:cytochrome c-type biogenesis protein CcmH